MPISSSPFLSTTERWVKIFLTSSSFPSFNIFVRIEWNSSFVKSSGYTPFPGKSGWPFAKLIFCDIESIALIPFCASKRVLVISASLLPFATSLSKYSLNSRLCGLSSCIFIFSNI